MITTHRIVCETCDTKHLLKVTIGREDNQTHLFPCTECEEEIEFGIENLLSVTDAHFRYGKNCKEGSFDYSEAIQVHLNPDFGVGHKVVEAGDLFTGLISKTLEMQRMQHEFEEEANEDIIQHRVTYENFNSEKLRFYLKVWSLLRKEKVELANRYILKNANEFGESLSKEKAYYKEKFLNHVIGAYGLEVYNNLCAEKAKAGDLSDLVSFGESQNVDTFEIFEEFLELFSEFSQVFTYLNRGLSISDNAKMSSTNFNRTKKYYSSAYEALAKMFYIPAGINNSIHRGDPHKFERLDSLQKYVSTGNGDKLRCVNGNSNLNILEQCYDNHLRNASFHNHMKYNSKKSKITYKQNSGTIISMNYKEYLTMCIKVTEANAALALFCLIDLKK